MILLLGSFDAGTRALLDHAREALASSTISIEWPTLVLLLDDVDLFRGTSTGAAGSMFFVLESSGPGAIHVVDGTEWVESSQLPPGHSSPEAALAAFARDRYAASVVKLPILEKLRALAVGRPLTFLLRDREETRGGEYIELAFLLGLSTAQSRNRIWFMRRDLIPISQMAEEILDMYGVVNRSYSDEHDLLAQLSRIAHYQADDH